ncbi:MAG: EAL domain-containing protein [Candidatus Contendobacter sp.]|nr:EAL domain-containing protein [Candidatus Contendobacter sp.]MDG4558433.1 EAL domain-containing protein [Candidatus Contendobacter sp.]
MINELLDWNDAEPVEVHQPDDAPPWKLLVVDDDPEVHSVTRFVLHDLRIFDRPLRLLHAHSAQEARERLRQHPDIAVALVDVVMETDQAGLDLVEYIRNQLGLAECRLILRTGQPGYAPELTVIHQYDINDYRTKAELTHTRLITTVSAALRAYEQLRALAENRRGLELIIHATAQLMEQHAIASLAEGILTQLAALLGQPVDGVVCVQDNSSFGGAAKRCHVVGAAGRYALYVAQPLEALPDRRIVDAILGSVALRQHVFGADHAVLCLNVAPCQEAAIFVDSGQALAALDRPLLEVFVNHAAACLRNASLVESLLRAQREIERQRAFLRTVIDADPHFIYVKNRRGQILLANQGLAENFGLTPEQMVGRTLSDLIADPEWARALLDDDMVIFTQALDRIEREVKFVDATGHTRWTYTVKAPIKNEAGEIEQVIGVNTDITERKRAEEALFEEKERAQTTLHSIGDAVITTDARGVVDYLNPVAETLTGWTTAEARGRPLREVFRTVNEQTRQPAPDPVARCLREGKTVGLADHSVLIRRDGAEYDIDDSAAPIRGWDGQMLGAVLVFHDVTETRRLTRQLAHDATHDALTGLINRPEFERRLERALASARQYGARHALCYLDLDQFKVVNDTAGHAAGDELLKQINIILSGMFRERDTLARLGGDEFGLLLDNCPLDRAQVIAQTVVSNIRDYRFHWEGRSYQIGVSIGLTPITAETRDTVQLLTQADVACYVAKELGRNRVHLYQQEDSETALRHSEILGAAGLRDALEQGRFRLYYQPIVPLDAPDPRPVRYEALLRVAYRGDPSQVSELVLPAAFIPAAERYGLMGAIDRWVIQMAFRDYARGIGQTSARIAINLSGNSLSDESLLGFIEAQFAEYAFSPERVCFEITETAAIQNPRHAVELVTALKQRGSQLALDDFGSGLSSFHYLKTLPVDYLKIDGSFVKDMMTNASDHALVAAINQMSHTLGIQTIAEYAHNRAIVERLRELGVDYAQGYFFGQPMPWGEASCE